MYVDVCVYILRIYDSVSISALVLLLLLLTFFIILFIFIIMVVYCDIELYLWRTHVPVWISDSDSDWSKDWLTSGADPCALHAGCPLLLWDGFHYAVYNMTAWDKIQILLLLLCTYCRYKSDVQFVCKSENTFTIYSVLFLWPWVIHFYREASERESYVVTKAVTVWVSWLVFPLLFVATSSCVSVSLFHSLLTCVLASALLALPFRVILRPHLIPWFSLYSVLCCSLTLCCFVCCIRSSFCPCVSCAVVPVCSPCWWLVPCGFLCCPQFYISL